MVTYWYRVVIPGQGEIEFSVTTNSMRSVPKLVDQELEDRGLTVQFSECSLIRTEKAKQNEQRED